MPLGWFVFFGKTSQKPTDSCASFPIDKGEISCEEAKQIATKKFPGQVLSIEKTSYRKNFKKQIQTTGDRIWLVQIKPYDLLSSLKSLENKNNLKEVKTVIMAIDPLTKDILAFKLQK